MDKKAKKRIEVIRQKLTTLQQQLAGAKRQPDDPQEPARLQAEIDKLQAELGEVEGGSNKAGCERFSGASATV